MPNPVLANATNILKASSVRPVRVALVTATAFGVLTNVAVSVVHPGWKPLTVQNVVKPKI